MGFGLNLWAFGFGLWALGQGAKRQGGRKGSCLRSHTSLDHTATFKSGRELIEASGEVRKAVAHFAMVALDDVREIGKIPLDA